MVRHLGGMQSIHCGITNTSNPYPYPNSSSDQQTTDSVTVTDINSNRTASKPAQDATGSPSSAGDAGAAESVNGEVNVEQTASANMLRFCFRPEEDPQTSLFTSDRKVVRKFLVRIRRRKREESSASTGLIQAQVCGTITSEITFENSVPGFIFKQEEPFPQDLTTVQGARAMAARVLDEFEAKQSEPGLSDKELLRHRDGMFCSSLLERAIVRNRGFAFMPRELPQKKKKPVKSQPITWHPESNTSKPKSALTGLKEVTFSLDKEVRSVEQKVQRAFEIRPIWLLSTLSRRLGVDAHKLARIASKFALRASSGAFNGAFIRFDYDPRDTAKSRRFQVVTFTVGHEMKIRLFKQRKGREIMLMGLPLLLRNRWQLCDIRDDLVRSLIKAPLPSNAAFDTSNEAHSGWFRPEVIDRVRTFIKSKVRNANVDSPSDTTACPTWDNEDWATTQGVTLASIVQKMPKPPPKPKGGSRSTVRSKPTTTVQAFQLLGDDNNFNEDDDSDEDDSGSDTSASRVAV